MKKFLAIALVAFSVFSANALTATVVSVKGKVEIQEAGMWVTLQKGDVLEKGTVISTGFNSEAVLNVSNSSVTLGALTRVTIENLVSTKDKDTTQLYIDSGSLSANVSGKDGKRAGFKVRSPVATASVRGTSFTVSSSGKLKVAEGLVAFGAPESESASVVEDSPAEAVASNEEAPVAKNDSVESTSKEAPAETPVETPAETASESKDQGHANAFASASDVGGEGVPVAAGQSSKAAATGSTPSSPRTEMAKAAVGGTDSTVTVSAQNSVAAGSSAAGSAPVSAAVSAGSVRATGSIAVTVVWSE